MSTPWTVIGIDPGSDYTGVGVVRSDGSTAMHRVRLRSDALGHGCELFRVIDSELPGTDVRYSRIAFEVPPKQVRSDVRHGPQAPIGYSLGFINGMIFGRYSDRLFTGQFVPVQVPEWRDSMFVDAARRRQLLSRPSRKTVRQQVHGAASPVDHLRRVGASIAEGWDVYWRGCKHVTRISDTDHLKGIVGMGGCPTCRSKPVASTADQIRGEWKRTACIWAKERDPSAYNAVVGQAKEKARSIKEDHLYLGVADACEALGVANHVAMNIQQGATP